MGASKTKPRTLKRHEDEYLHVPKKTAMIFVIIFGVVWVPIWITFVIFVYLSDVLLKTVAFVIWLIAAVFAEKDSLCLTYKPSLTKVIDGLHLYRWMEDDDGKKDD